MTDIGTASASMAGVTSFAVLALARIKGVGPLLLTSRILDRWRAFHWCFSLAWTAGRQEYRRMWASCLARAQRER